jgi:hypothetical protein
LLENELIDEPKYIRPDADRYDADRLPKTLSRITIFTHEQHNVY